jgi:hypothetical protein
VKNNVWLCSGRIVINLSTLELNPSVKRCLPRFFTGILIFKGLTARRIYKSSGVKGLDRRLLSSLRSLNSLVDSQSCPRIHWYSRAPVFTDSVSAVDRGPKKKLKNEINGS